MLKKLKLFFVISAVFLSSLVTMSHPSLSYAQEDDGAINPVEPPTNETFDLFNPLKIAGGENLDEVVASEHAEQLSTPGGIVSRLLQFIFPLAGLMLFVMIVWGGFEIMSGAGDKNKIQAGKTRITSAIVGFLILFSSYWLTQVIEVVFGIVVL